MTHLIPVVQLQLKLSETSFGSGKYCNRSIITRVSMTTVNIHGAKKGSGGVGFIIRNDLARQFNIMIEDDSVEGILSLKFVSKSNNTKLHTCVCYSPPIDSTRNIDANEFFDNLIS